MLLRLYFSLTAGLRSTRLRLQQSGCTKVKMSNLLALFGKDAGAAINRGGGTAASEGAGTLSLQ